MRLESSGGEGGTWRSGHVARVIVAKLLQNWLEQTRLDLHDAGDVYSADDEAGRPDWMRRSLRLLPDDVSIGLAVLDAMVDTIFQGQPKCNAQLNCGLKSGGCSANHFLGILRSEDGVTRILRKRRTKCNFQSTPVDDCSEVAEARTVSDNCAVTKLNSGAKAAANHDEDGKCEDHRSAQRPRCTQREQEASTLELSTVHVSAAEDLENPDNSFIAADRPLLLRELLWAVAEEPSTQIQGVCVDVIGEALAGAAMRPRLLALTMGHHNRLGAGCFGRRCWLRELDAHLLVMIARASCTISVYAAALADLIFPPETGDCDLSMLSGSSSAIGEETQPVRRNSLDAAKYSEDRGVLCKVSSLDNSEEQSFLRPAKRRG
jgi:hypothetical protein